MKQIKKQTIASLFKTHPPQWGLRGDPHVWQKMKAKLRNTPLPENAEQLKTIISEMFFKITNQPITASENFYMDEIAQLDRGGLSRGMVCPAWWSKTALPFLVKKYSENS